MQGKWISLAFPRALIALPGTPCFSLEGPREAHAGRLVLGVAGELAVVTDVGGKRRGQRETHAAIQHAGMMRQRHACDLESIASALELQGTDGSRCAPCLLPGHAGMRVDIAARIERKHATNA